MMNNRLKMLEVSLEEESDEESNIPPTNLPLNKFLQANDRFKSTAVTRGLFASADDQIDYHFVSINPVGKKQEQLTSINLPAMKIQNDISHSNSQHQNKDIVQNVQIIFNDQSLEKVQVQENDKIEQESLTSNKFQKMLQFVLSENQSSSDEEDSQSQKQPQKKSQSQIITYPVKKIDASNLIKNVNDLNQFSRKYSIQPINEGEMLQLGLFRDSTGINKIWPEFNIFLGQNNKLLMHAKKMMGSTTSNFYICTQEGIDNVEHLNFLAKLRGNYSGSTYNVFDRGINPIKASIKNKARTIQATIRFKTQIKNMEPREFEVFLLKSGINYYDLDGISAQKQIGLDALYELSNNKQLIHCFKNRKPVYSPALKGYILNFGGRVQKPSIKNFILEEPNKRKEVLMLGKINEDIFRVDVSSPIPPYIAICICMANFDSKFLSD